MSTSFADTATATNKSITLADIQAALEAVETHSPPFFVVSPAEYERMRHDAER